MRVERSIGTVLAALLTLCAGAAAAATVSSFSPVGEAPVVRQARAVFSTAMVPMGEPDAPSPFSVDCTTPGNSRWLDARTWVYDFQQPVPAGTRCSFVLRAGLVAKNGEAMSGPTRFVFDTGGPAIAHSMPSEGSAIDEGQAFVLTLTGPVDAATLRDRVWCQAEGIGERIPARPLPAADRDVLLRRFSSAAPGRTEVVACARRLPNDAPVTLVWDAGIATPSGIALRRRQVLRFQVRPAFQATLSCQRENANAPCTPLAPIRVEFTSAVERRLAQAVRLKFGAAERAPEPVDEGRTLLDGVTFKPPFPENAGFAVHLPAELRDADGRALANATSFPLASRTAAYPPLAKFTAAPFGIVESMLVPPMVPVTLRDVEADLMLKGFAPERPGLRELRLQSDAQIIEWSARLRQFHERTLGEDEVRRAFGEPPRKRAKDEREPLVESRTLSLLAREPGATRIVLPAPATPPGAAAAPPGTAAAPNAPGASAPATRASGDGQRAGRPFEVIGVPLPEPGYYVLELDSARLGEALLGRSARMYVRSSALVTNMAVHFKRSREQAMVWVTTLDEGRPVASAQVQVSDCRGRPLWQGTTDASGQARIAQALPEHSGECEGNRPGYFVSARSRDARGRADLSFVWSEWDQGIEPWRFGVPTADPGEAVTRVHTIFDRTLLRGGETVSMKHLVRVASAEGLSRPPDGSLPKKALVVHTGSDETYSFDLQWRGAAAETVFRIPAAAKLGRYQVYLDYGEPPEDEPAGAKSKRWWDGRRESGAFRVEAFRMPVFEGRLALSSPPSSAAGGKPTGPAVASTTPTAPLVAPATVPVQAQVNFTAGGPAAGLPMQVSALLRPWAPRFEEHAGFTFEREDLWLDDEGAEAAPGPALGATAAPEPAPAQAPGPSAGVGGSPGAARDSPTALARRGLFRDRLVADKLPLTLDAAGAGRVAVDGLPAVSVPHRLVVEGTFADPNGEIQTIRSHAILWPSAHVVGLRTKGWIDAGRQLEFTVVTLDVAGKPRPGAKVTVTAVLRRTISHRKRLVGGFYAYDSSTQERVLGEVCAGASGERGQLECRFEPKLAPGETGNLLLIAQSADAQGRVGSAATSVWLGGRGELWFAADNHDRMDVLPERRRYAPGEVAKLQVRLPFRHATAWVAIEREGIVETRVVPLNGRDPTLELKVQPHWGPNVYVSVLAVRGRLREVPWYSLFVWGWRSPVEWWRERQAYATESLPTATVDLAKPTFRLGVAEIAVDSDAQRLKVEVVPDRADYPVRGTAKVQVRVRTPDGKSPPAGTEVALAAVDQALLELAPNDSWKLFEAMMQRRTYGVQTATAQMQVVGRRHYGRKALPAGGDGGRSPTRELFDTLLAWHPRIALDAEGRASVDVKLNDSLTSFRIVAVADGGPGSFGTGEAAIRTTQDLQVIAGLPLAVREGDAFNAMVTLRNTTAQPMKVSFEASVVATVPVLASTAGTAPGLAAGGTPAREVSLPPVTQQVDLPAGSARLVTLPVRVPDRATALRWTLQAGDVARKATDRVSVRQDVAPAVPVTVRQATLAPVAPTLALPVSVPADALPGRSELRVSLASSIAGSLDGVRDWFARYPYVCLEQKASRAVGLGDAAAWRALMEQLPPYLDADGLAQYFPARAGDAPGGSEVLTAYLLSVAHEAGLEIPVESRDRLLGGLVRYVEGRVRRNAWTPRPGLADETARRLAAVEALSRYGRANASMVSALAVDPARLPASALIDWVSLLGRVQEIPRRDAQRTRAEALLRARLVDTGSRLGFVQEEQDRWWWLMASPDGNAARLVLWASAQEGWKTDAPRLLTGLIGRQRRGAWDTTPANAWGVLAVRRFSSRFEATPVSGTTRIELQRRDAPVEPVLHRWPAPVPATRAAPAPTTTTTATPAATPAATPTATTATAIETTKVLALGPGEASLRIAHEGAGAPWASVQALASVPLTGPAFAGYRLGRTVTAVQRKQSEAWSRGDIVRVQVTVEAAQPMTWVVVSDPLPAGATVLGSGLGRDSAIAMSASAVAGASAAAATSSVVGGAALARAPSFEERRPDVVRAYYDVLPAGRHTYAYTLRLSQDGDFGLPPTRVEAMYAPEVFGELPNARWRVAP